MATYYSGYSRGYRLRLELTESNVSVDNNTSAVNWALYLEFGNRSFAGRTDSGYGDLNGIRVWTPASSYNFSGVYNTSRLLGSGSITATHNSDGTKSVPFSFAFSANSGGYGPTGLSMSGSFTLSTIPRASTPSISPANIVMGGNADISISRASSAFTHNLYYTFAGKTYTIATGVSTTASVNTPLSLANYIPNNTSGTATLICDTYNGSSKIGSKSVSFTLNVPANIYATISSIDTVESNSTVRDAFNLDNNRYVKGLSKLGITINPDLSNAYGATVSSYTTTVDGVNYSGKTFTTNTLTKSGTVNISSKIIDSRGRAYNFGKTVTIIDYAAPKIDLSINPSGNTVICTIAGKVYPVDNANSRLLTLEWKKTIDSEWQSKVVSAPDWEFNVTSTVYNIDPDVTYDFRATLADKISTQTATATTGVVCISRLAGGRGVTFFGEAEEPGFIVKSNHIRVKPNVPNIGETKVLHDNNGTDTDYGSYFMDTDDNTYNNYSSIRIYRKKALQDQISMVTRKNGGTREAYNILGEHNTADRVIETGVTNGLTWRKWSSGIAECWGRFNLTVSPYTTNEMPGIPYGYYYDFKLPFEFVSLPCRVANISTYGAPTVNITGGLADTNTVVRVYWASTLNHTSHTVNVQIYGNWK